VSRELASRYLNDGFSGGEKKRIEILQLAMLKPRIACSTRPIPGSTSTRFASSHGACTSSSARTWARLVITHYQRILNFIKPDFVHVMVNGVSWRRAVRSLRHKLEAEGYERYGKAA
jgi:Fe-S cluster assembly ATP-binding protein